MWPATATRPWVRLLVAWLVLAGTIVAGMRAHERLSLGTSDADGATRIAAAISREFSSAERSLEEAAASIGREIDLVRRAQEDRAAARDLFGVLQRLDSSSRELSATVFTPTATPLAWSGRPTDLPRARILASTPATFVAPSPLGPRLFLVRPLATSSPSSRIGTLVVERSLPTVQDARPQPGDEITWTVANVPVRLRARYQGAGTHAGPDTFLLTTQDGTPLLEGRVAPEDVGAGREVSRRRTMMVLLLLTAACVVIAVAPLSAWRARARTAATVTAATLAACAAVMAARALAWFALGDASAPEVASLWPGLAFRSSVDFLLTAASALLMTVVLGGAVVRLRRARHAHRRPPSGSTGRLAGFLSLALAGGLGIVAAFAGMAGLIRASAETSPTDLRTFALHLGDPSRFAAETGLVVAACATVWLAVTALLATTIPFRVDRSRTSRGILVALWALPSLVWVGIRSASPGWPEPIEVLPPALMATTIAANWSQAGRLYRRATQAARLVLLFAAFVAPVLAWYPALWLESDRARREDLASRLAPQATRQREDLLARVRQVQSQIDSVQGLADMVQAAAGASVSPVPTDAAFLAWSQTDLARYRLTSAVELYGPNGLLVSRFALKLPDYTSAQQVWEGSGCGWELFEEVSPFFSEERRLLYAGRGLCVQTPAGPRAVGAIAIYAMLDYGDLPFIASQNPYVTLVGGEQGAAPRLTESHGDVGFVVYGWSRTPVYASGPAWTLDDTTFDRVYQSRDPFWTTMSSAGRDYSVYLANDRGGIYALGFPDISPVEHTINAAELVILGGVAFAFLTLVAWLMAVAGGYRGLRGRDLLRELRASFYRKLFLAFVAAAAIPILTLAVVARAYLASRLMSGIEEAAARTALVAQRVVEDYSQLQERGDRRAESIDDDILVWIARVIDQDVNVFDGASLVATSERNLYASGVLPTRTSADIYRAIALDRRAAFVGTDRVGWFDYMAASAPVKLEGREAILTVPLMLRQQAIEQEIDDLNRRILLAVLAFILAGSGLGYWMAERIADPVNRLQRATARLARGDLTARVALTSADEFRRLVEAFNRMAEELQRHQQELARTHKLEAWADMARQVAHEIKNPLTPIQLSAEHLRRVHVDRGSPLSPVLDGCVDSILTQVRLLRQIAGEFSSFASSPTARPVETAIDELVGEVVDPYRPGLAGKVHLAVDVSADLPRLWVDRPLLGRALTNVIDNALHAMPKGGTLSVRAALGDGAIELLVTDTGVGMDEAAVARIFEPYFSTKATGTGLGLTIAKRNVELHGGAIAVDSAPGRGTTVTMRLPLRAIGPSAGH